MRSRFYLSVTRGIGETILIFLMILAVGTVSHAASKKLLWGFALDGYPITEEQLQTLVSETDIRPSLIVFFLQWPSPDTIDAAEFSFDSLDAIRASGAVPCLTWEPMYYRWGEEIMIPHGDILSGGYDRYLEKVAVGAKTWGHPFMIRFAHEMNIDRYHWGTEAKDYGPGSPGIYREVFRYVVSFFRKRGVTNVRWVFCPNAESTPNVSYEPTAGWNKASAYYPGGEYVDIVGMDGYNWGVTQTKERDGWDSRWKSFDETFRELYCEMREIAPGKPVIVFETASSGEGGDRGCWIRETLKTARKWNLTGVVWFQASKKVDWRIHYTGEKGYNADIKNHTFHTSDWLR